MELIRNLFKRTVLMIILISVLITFLATPASYAKLELEDGDFYYAGTTDGAYVPTYNVFAWLVNCIGDIADWILGMITMAPRMVFVGWTALLEKLLTWALESTTGVTADGSVVDSSTDMSGIADSSSNITVEAIVYNKVAALNIDFFDLEFDATSSGTGKKLICDFCEKPVEECMPESVTQPVKEAGEALIAAEDEYNSYTSSLVGLVSGENELRRQAKEKVNAAEKARIDAVETALETANCGCNGCDECVKYLKQLSIREPLIIKLRMLVATWYSIIRFLAMAAMLVILIAIGIKMALSTIASDKAVYKRMLVDWIVGVIILFAIHYFMIFCIHMNGVVIKTIENSAQSINKVQMQQLFGDEEGVSNAELEVKVYEEVRTRAYDARLINGMTGMIMYMTLVFFAFKYTLIYLKRYLTILVLTLMGPAVGLAYALQKALSGKSSALSTWMKEYIMNVIIQIVHALLYAVFISQAMIMSLQSVAGMGFALILMNYVSKADELFKKIFNFGGGDSLLGHTENAMQSTMQGIQTAKGLVTGAKPIVNAAKGEVKLAKAGIAAAVGLGTGAVNASRVAIQDIFGTSKKEESSNAKKEPVTSSNENNDKEGENSGDNGPKNPGESAGTPPSNSNGENSQQVPKNDAQLLEYGGTKLRQDIASLTDNIKKLGDPPKDPKGRAEYDKKKSELELQRLEAMEKYDRFQKLTTPSTTANLRGKVKRSIDMENVFETTEGVTPTLGAIQGKNAFTRGMKHLGSAFVQGARSGSSFMNGRTTFNPRTMSFENTGTKGLLNMYKQFSPSNFFALTDKDKEKMKKITGTMVKALSGMSGIFFGMGMLVAEPSKGMALMAGGYAGTHAAFGRNLKLSKGSGKYTFSRFGSQSLNTIKNSALVRAKQEHDKMVAQAITADYPGLAEKLKNGDASAITLGELSGEIGPLFVTQNSPYSQVATAAMIENYGGKKARFMKNTALGAQMDDFAKHYAKQQRKQIDQFTTEAAEMEKTAIEARIEYKKEKFGKIDENDEKRLKELESILAEQGYGIDEDGDIIELDKNESNDDKDIFAAVLLAAEEDAARMTGETVSAESISKKYDVQIDDIQVQNGDKKITQTDVNLVNKTIDDILVKVSQGDNLELSSEKDFDKVIQLLSTELAKSKLLSDGQSAEELFKDGKEGLKKQLRKKTEKRKAAIAATTKKLEEVFTPEGAAAMKSVIEEVASEKTSKGKSGSEIVVSEILERVERADGSLKVKSADGSVKATISDGTHPVSTADGSKSIGGQKLNSDQMMALQQFMQVTRGTTPKKVDKKKAEQIKNEVEERRNKKVEQAILALISEEPEADMTELTKVEQDYVTSITRDLLALKELNLETARLNRDKVSGPKVYTSAVKEESSARIEVARIERDILIEESRTDVTEPQRVATVEDLKKQLDNKKTALRKKENQTAINGPVINIAEYVKSGFASSSQESLPKSNSKKKRK